MAEILMYKHDFGKDDNDRARYALLTVAGVKGNFEATLSSTEQEQINKHSGTMADGCSIIEIVSVRNFRITFAMNYAVAHGNRSRQKHLVKESIECCISAELRNTYPHALAFCLPNLGELLYRRGMFSPSFTLAPKIDINRKDAEQAAESKSGNDLQFMLVMIALVLMTTAVLALSGALMVHAVKS